MYNPIKHLLTQKFEIHVIKPYFYGIAIFAVQQCLTHIEYEQSHYE